MPNFISSLIILVAALIGITGDYVPNQLLNLGLLITLAYLLSLVMRFFKLPTVLGYILAGAVAGHNGLGLLHEKFLSSMSFIEGLATMLLVSSVVRYMLKGQTTVGFSKYFASGAISSLITLLLTTMLLLTTGFITPLPIPIKIKIIVGLFAATFSPLMSYAYTVKNKPSQHYIQTAFGGYITAIILWGILMPFCGPAHPDRIKLAAMPAVISITSTMAGFAWSLIVEKLLYYKSRGFERFFPFVSMFLIYPCCSEIGLDYLFIALGTGVYYGIISEQAGTLEQTEKASLIVFSFFGINLSLESVLLIGIAGWKLVVLIVLCMVFSRIITLKLSLNLIFSKPGSHLPTFFLIPYGPMTVIVLQRFLSGINTGLYVEFDKFEIYSLFTTSMILTIIIVSVTNLIIGKMKKIQATQS